MLFKNLHREFIFSLDGAATEHDTLLPRFTDDISRQSWVSEKVFCNPPYSDIPSFLLKASEADLVAFLIPHRANTSYWLRHIYSNNHCHEIRILHRAVKYLPPAGLAYAREGDTVVVVAVDRLGRDTIDVLSTVKALQAKGVTVISLREGFDLSSAMGEAMLGIMSTLAQLERSLIAERRKAGIERAKAEGVHMGRPVKASSEAVQTLISQGKTRLQIQEELGISRATYYRLAK
ncbi:DNA invertase-like protein [Shigella sonnei]|nr:DNA invertase-like protein [Shigella sonnei]SIZ65351.1 DNA invertase-like protein [Shigella sonnei]SJH15919.1 DNA invertase-like protein [Shigella sonnei]